MADFSFRLDGDVGLVTGAASGIGQAIAVAMAEAGAAVGCADLASADMGQTLSRIGDVGGRAVAIACDVTDEAEVEASVAQVERELGPLTLAVNSAGIANAAPAVDMPLRQWQKVYDVDVTGVFLCSRAQARVMLPRRRGSIVNIASMSGTIVNRGLLQAHYNSAKAAVQHLSKSLAMEWAADGVRVNSVSPGYTATPMNVRAEVAEAVKQFEADTPLGRMATPSEIAGPTVFLLSSAAAFCTGVDLLVDGGFCCW